VVKTADGKRAVSASRSQTLSVWDLEEGKVVAALTADTPPFSCALGPDGRVIVAGDQWGRVHLLSLELEDHN
jgi:WD40 repeat protein